MTVVGGVSANILRAKLVVGYDIGFWVLDRFIPISAHSISIQH